MSIVRQAPGLHDRVCIVSGRATCTRPNASSSSQRVHRPSLPLAFSDGRGRPSRRVEDMGTRLSEQTLS